MEEKLTASLTEVELYLIRAKYRFVILKQRHEGGNMKLANEADRMRERESERL